MTFNELFQVYAERHAYYNEGHDFAQWLDQRFAPVALPTGAQPEVSSPLMAASTVPAADNGGDGSFLYIQIKTLAGLTLFSGSAAELLATADISEYRRDPCLPFCSHCGDVHITLQRRHK